MKAVRVDVCDQDSRPIYISNYRIQSRQTLPEVLGRVLFDGSYVTKSWIIRNYFTGHIHHRSRKPKRGY